MNNSIDRAWDLTHGDRHKEYGNAVEVFEAYAKIWSGLLAKKLKEDITASDVTLMMTALKLAREAGSPKDDNVVDAHGYLILLDEVKCDRFGKSYSKLAEEEGPLGGAKRPGEKP